MKTIPILKRAIKWRFHHSFTILITILQPMLWLILYTQIAKQSMRNLGIENYVAYVFAGLIFLVSFGACSSGGIMNYLMKNDGSFYRVIKSPINRSSIILGQILESVLCSLLEVSIMLIIGLLFGLVIYANFIGILLIFILIIIVNFCIASFTYLISLLLPNEIIYETVMNAIILPIFFLSPALFPTTEITGFFGFLIKMNPFTYAINSLRSLILENTVLYSELLLTIGIFLSLGSILFLLALRKLQNVSNY